jgi:peptidoglycan/xylan/chitin deacetylase (PgdA/CDA1 family)
MMAIGRTVERTADAALNRSPLQPLFRRRANGRLTVLAYHDVADPTGFERQVRYLRTAMSPVSLGDVIGALNGSGALPPRAVLVTFDDGDRSVYEAAMPILRSYGVPAVVFVVAGLLGTDEPFWWLEVPYLVERGATAAGLPHGDPARCVRLLKQVPNEQRKRSIDRLRKSMPQVRLRTPQLEGSNLVEMEAVGIAIGNHTRSHPCLDRCADSDLESEITDAHSLLARELGHPPAAFAYPNGNVDERAAPVLSKLGYAAAFLFDHRIGPMPPADRYRISRLRVSSTTSSDRFGIIVSGLHPTMHHLAGRP